MTQPAEQEQQALDQLVTALTYAQSIQAIGAALEAFPDVLPAAVDVLLRMPPIRGLVTLNREKSGPHVAEIAMRRQNLLRRAAYLVSAARRLTTAVKAHEIPAALRVERRYLAAHLDANANRTLAARAVAATAKVQGTRFSYPVGVIGWYATLDERTSPECRRANGRNFDPSRIPPIGFPGTVHPHCRCRPGPPHRNAERVEDLQPDEAPAPQAEIAASRAAGQWRISGGTL